jgi:hypothetical protein
VAATAGERRTIAGETVTGADYSGRGIGEFVSVGSRFESCDFRDMRLKAARFGSGPDTSQYVDCVFDGSRISAGYGMARFVRCSFRDVDVRKWNQDATELIGCTFTGRLQSCTFYGEHQPLSGGPPRTNEFHGNDFSGAELIKVEFRWGVDLTRQRLPEGPDYVYVPDAAATLAAVRKAAQDWPEPRRKRADDLLDTWERELSLGQRQLLLRASEWGTSEVDAEIVELLRQTC